MSLRRELVCRRGGVVRGRGRACGEVPLRSRAITTKAAAAQVVVRENGDNLDLP
jgi:hypothetical protein